MQPYNHISIEAAGSVTIIRLDVNRAINRVKRREIQEDLLRLHDRKPPLFLFELSSLDAIGPLSIDIFFDFAQKISALGGTVRFCDVRPEIRELLEKRGQEKTMTLDIRGTEEEALAEDWP